MLKATRRVSLPEKGQMLPLFEYLELEDAETTTLHQISRRIRLRFVPRAKRRREEFNFYRDCAQELSI